MRAGSSNRRAFWLAASIALTACSSSNPTPVFHSAQVVTPAPSAEPTAKPGDWPTYGFDTARTSDNPGESVLTSASIAARGLVKLWEFGAAGIVIAQPVVASGVTIGSSTYDVAYAGDNLGNFYALDASDGNVLWSKKLQAATNTGCTDLPDQVFGISDAAAIDRATNRVYVVDGKALLYAFDLASGAPAAGWANGVPLLPNGDEHVYGGLTLDATRHELYAGAGSLCDDPPYRGQVVAVDTESAAVTARFFSLGSSDGTGGGVWGAGGVSLDPRGTGVVYAFTANAAAAPPGSHPDSIVSLEPDLAAVIGAIEPDPSVEDYGFGSTPTIVPPADGCPAYEAFGKNKNGILYDFENVDALSSPALVERIPIAPPELSGVTVGTVAYSPLTNMIYTSNGETLTGATQHGLLAFAIQPSCGLDATPAWSNVNGPNGIADDPPGNPSVAADVVYYTDGPSGDVWAFGAASGNVLWTSALGGASYTAPSIADGRIFVALWEAERRARASAGPAGS